MIIFYAFVFACRFDSVFFGFVSTNMGLVFVVFKNFIFAVELGVLGFLNKAPVMQPFFKINLFHRAKISVLLCT